MGLRKARPGSGWAGNQSPDTSKFLKKLAYYFLYARSPRASRLLSSRETSEHLAAGARNIVITLSSSRPVSSCAKSIGGGSSRQSKGYPFRPVLLVFATCALALAALPSGLSAKGGAPKHLQDPRNRQAISSTGSWEAGRAPVTSMAVPSQTPSSSSEFLDDDSFVLSKTWVTGKKGSDVPFVVELFERNP